jgi:Holliday junction DNA helicase RuvA
MYEFLKGNIAEASPAHVVLECNGIGYFVNISITTYTKIQTLATVQLLIHETIREDAFILYGFFDKAERELFKLLISVAGVGSNTARMMLSSYSADELATAIASENLNVLKGIKGIGLKTAQRIIVELKDKIEKKAFDTKLFASINNTIRDEALSALVMLGFVKSPSLKVVDKLVGENPELKVEAIIKMALKML